MNLIRMSILGAIVTLQYSHSAIAQSDFPNRPLRIVTGGAGGGSDFVSRLIAQGLTGSINQQVIVDNRASGVIPGDTVAKAQPDGYTALLAGSGFWLGQFMQTIPYDSVKDFAPLTLVSSSPAILVIHPSLAAKTVKDLITLAKAKPGTLNYASGSTGSHPHLAMELFKAMSGADIVRVTYKSAGSPQMPDLLSGQVHMTIAISSLVAQHVKAQRLRALAVTSAQPSPLVPGVPTVAASGLPGYVADQLLAMFVPAKTPQGNIRILNTEIVRVLKRDEMREKFANAGLDVVGSSAEELAAIVKSEMVRMGKVIKDANIRAE